MNWHDVWKPYVALLIGVLAIMILAWSSVQVRAADEVCGVASWYGLEHHGRRTASGAIFNQWAMTAAMPSRSHLGERWRVTYKGKSVTVKITDVGPARRLHRMIDLSRGAAGKLGMVNTGLARVCMHRLN